MSEPMEDLYPTDSAAELFDKLMRNAEKALPQPANVATAFLLAKAAIVTVLGEMSATTTTVPKSDGGTAMASLLANCAACSVALRRFCRISFEASRKIGGSPSGTVH